MRDAHSADSPHGAITTRQALVLRSNPAIRRGNGLLESVRDLLPDRPAKVVPPRRIVISEGSCHALPDPLFRGRPRIVDPQHRFQNLGENPVFHRFASAVLGLGLLVAGAAETRGAISLVGLDVYSSTSQGAVTNTGFRYSSNSRDPGSSYMFVTPTSNSGATQGKAIIFALVTGANTFTFTPNNNFGLADPYGGIEFFFNQTGVSYNPTDDSHAGDLAAYALAGGTGFTTPTTGTSILDDGPGGGGRPLTTAPPRLSWVTSECRSRRSRSTRPRAVRSPCRSATCSRSPSHRRWS